MTDAPEGLRNLLSHAYALDARDFGTVEQPGGPGESQLWIFRAAAGERFVAKLTPRFDGALEPLYADLAALGPSTPRLILPRPSERNVFVTRFDTGGLMIFPFVAHESLIRTRRPLGSALEMVRQFHESIRGVRAPVRQQRTFASYLERARSALAAPPALADLFDRFARTRLPHLTMREGPIHFDLNPSNVWIDDAGAWCVADFDDVQMGPLAKDVLEIASTFLGLSADGIDLPTETETAVYDALGDLIDGITRADVRLLLLRPRANEVTYAQSVVTRFLERE